MELSFNKTFSPVVKIVACGGFFLPGSNVLYPRFSKIVKILTQIMCVAAIINFIMEAANQFTFMAHDRAEGETNLFMVLSFGVIMPTYIFLIYAHRKIPQIKKIIDIWENEMKNPPYPDDRKAEIANIQRYIFRIVKAEIFGFIIPFTIWSMRTIVTKEPVLPVVHTGDITVSPTLEIVTIFFGYFGYSLATVWCTTENIKLLFIKCILAELNHLQLAAEKILTFRVNEKAVKEIKSPERSRELPLMREKFRFWIIYHQTVLRFSDEIIKFTAPTIFIQELCTIIFAFSDIFVLITGKVPIHNALSGLVYLLIYYYVMYVTNSLGDEIRIKSANLLETFNGREYYFYTKDIIDNIFIIQFVTFHRPINLRALWYKNLSRKSFGEITSKGYEIIAFMSHLI